MKTKIAKYNNSIGYILALFGLGLSFYLTLGKLSPLPCGTDSCHNVLSSKYSTLLGFPVSLYSYFVWVIVMGLYITKGHYAHTPQRIQINKLLFVIGGAMLLGSFVFIGIQIHLMSFCILCTLHALICFLFFGNGLFQAAEAKQTGNKVKLKGAPLAFILPLMLIGVIMTGVLYPKGTYTTIEKVTTPLEYVTIFPEYKRNTNVMVVSATCPACLERLRQLSDYLKQNPNSTVPQFVWDRHGRPEVLELLLAYLDTDGNIDAVLPFFNTNLQEGWNIEQLRTKFAEAFPNVNVTEKHREYIQKYGEWLAAHPVAYLPSLITKDGKVTHVFETKDLTDGNFIVASIASSLTEIHYPLSQPGAFLSSQVPVKNTGQKVVTLENRAIGSLPSGSIRWAVNTLAPGEETYGDLLWQIPNDYYGRANAVMSYDAQGVTLQIPVFVDVPYEGWVWPGFGASYSELHAVSLPITAVDTNATLQTCNVVEEFGYKCKVIDNTISFELIEGTLYEHKNSTLITLELQDSNGKLIKPQIMMHP